VGTPAAQTFVADRHSDVTGLDELREYAFSATSVAQVVITSDDVVALVNQQAELVLGLSNRDVGRPLRDLEISYRPVEPRAYVEHALAGRGLLLMLAGRAVVRLRGGQLGLDRAAQAGGCPEAGRLRPALGRGELLGLEPCSRPAPDRSCSFSSSARTPASSAASRASSAA
jgi:hypothetical protein